MSRTLNQLTENNKGTRKKEKGIKIQFTVHSNKNRVQGVGYSKKVIIVSPQRRKERKERISNMKN